MSLHLTADDSVESLGVAFNSLPPGPVVIHRVVPDSWADVQDLRAEDELVCMNGSKVAEMARHDFLKCIRERPLGLDISRPVADRSGKAAAASPQSFGSLSTPSSPETMVFSIASYDNLEKLQCLTSTADDEDIHETLSTTSGDDSGWSSSHGGADGAAEARVATSEQTLFEADLKPAKCDQIISDSFEKQSARESTCSIS